MILKTFIRMFLAIHVFIYRVSRGAFMGGIRGTPVLLLTTTGRKSGKQRTLPLGYVKVGQSFLVMASNGGAKTNPGWYYNLKDNPQAMIEVKGEKLVVQSEEAVGDERTQFWKRFMETAPVYKDYEKASREVPLMMLHITRKIGKKRMLPQGYNHDTQHDLMR